MKALNLDSINEANLVSIIGVNTAEFKYYIDKYSCLKVIKDTSLAIQLKSFAQENPSTFQKLIILIKHGNFLYAFPYTDEMLYCDANLLLYHNNKFIALDTLEKDFFLKRTNLEREFNYMIERIGLNQPRNMNRLQKFITLFEDSLLGDKFHELSLKDTTMLLKLANEGIHNPYGSITNTSAYTKNYKQIILDLKNEKNGDIRYFRLHEGFGAFLEV